MPRISPETFRILEAEASSLQSLGKELEDGIMLVAERIRDFREAVEKFAKKVQAAKIGQRVLPRPGHPDPPLREVGRRADPGPAEVRISRGRRDGRQRDSLLG